MTIPSLTMRQLEEKYPDAYASLPECYKADSCLVFTEWVCPAHPNEQTDYLFATHDMGETFYWCVGQWRRWC